MDAGRRAARGGRGERLATVPARAQTQLPGITVTTPSPVTPSPAPAQAPAAAPQPTQPAPDLAGTGLQISPDQSFVATTVVTPQQLLSQPSAALGDALAARPGIAATTFAPGASRPVIRGLSGFRVRIQENGIGTGDVSALSDDHAVPIDPLAAGQVEVVRGPATLRYGSQAIGGVVNAVNNRIPTAIPTNGILVETRGGLSTVDNGRNGAAIVEAGSGNFVVHADTFARSASDYSIPGGKQANTSLDSSGYSLGGSYVFKDGFIGAAYSSFDSTYFIPGIEAAAHKNHIVLNQTKWTSRGEWRVNDFGLEAVRFWFGAIDYKHDEVDLGPRHGHRLDLPSDDVRGAHGGAASARQDGFGCAARRRRHAVVEPRSAGGRGGRRPVRIRRTRKVSPASSSRNCS